MSQVNSADTRIIHSADDVIGAYQGVGVADSRAGLEVELAFFDMNREGIPPISVAQNEALMIEAPKKVEGDWIRQEPTSEMLEVNSIAKKFVNARAVLDDTNTKMQSLCATAVDMGFKRSFYQDLPHVPASELLSNVVNLERYQAFFKPPRADMFGIADYFSVSKSNQVSVSYANTDVMLNDIRRLYYLAPFLFVLSDNSSGFAEGKPLETHHGLHYRRFLEGRGGVPAYVFTSQSGDEYIQAHINHVMNNPLYVYYDENSKLTRIPSGQWESFEKLRERGLNTSANYHLAESVLWPDVKIAALKDDAGNVTDHRYEARMFGVGIHQHQTAFLIVAGLAFCKDFTGPVDTLLERYGFDPDPAQRCETRQRVINAYESAYYSGAKDFFNIAYGHGNMADFALEFADIVERASCMQNYQKELEPLMRICRSAMPDGKVNRLLFPTLDSVNKLQREYDPALFNDPNKCNHMIFEDRIGKIAA